MPENVPWDFLHHFLCVDMSSFIILVDVCYRVGGFLLFNGLQNCEN